MEKRAYALAAGLFVLVLGAALVAGVLWLNRDERVGGVPYEVATTRPVSGLKVEAPVRFRGVDVGKVESIRFDPADPGRVVIGITVESSVPITRSTFAQLGFQGVTGLSFVALDDDGAKREPLASTGVARAHRDAAVAFRHRRRGRHRVRRGGRTHQQAGSPTTTRRC
jgi:phospholipid/cholesterol/gamma-HCH transport system substrate-binding protein